MALIIGNHAAEFFHVSARDLRLEEDGDDVTADRGVGADSWVPPVCETARKKLTGRAAAAGWGTGLRGCSRVARE